MGYKITPLGEGKQRLKETEEREKNINVSFKKNKKNKDETKEGLVRGFLCHFFQ